MLTIIAGFFIILILLWGAQKFISWESVRRLGSIVLYCVSWIVAAGIAGAIVALAVHYALMPGIVFVFFTILYFVTKKKKIKGEHSSIYAEHTLVDVFKRPINIVSLIGLSVCAVLMLILWLIMAME